MATDFRNLMAAAGGMGGYFSGGNFYTGSGSLSPAAPGAYEPAYGGKPQVPNPAASSASAIAANTANLSSLYQMLGGINEFQGQQAANQLRMNLPGYDSLIGYRSGLIGQELAGQLPNDVINQLIQQAAERGITTGSPISPNANAAYLRALGLNSLDMQARGMANLRGAIADTPRAPLVNPESMFITPDAVQQAQMMANLYASAPEPGAAARAAMNASGLGSGNYGGGGIAGARPVSLGGGRANTNMSPDTIYSAGAAGALGPFYDRKAPNYNEWYNNLPSIPGVPNTIQGGWAPITPDMDPGLWGAPSGTGYDPFSNAYTRPGTASAYNNTDWNFWGGGGGSSMSDADFWGGWDDEFSFEPATPDSFWDPVMDVSVNPDSGYYNWSGVDLGLGGGGY